MPPTPGPILSSAGASGDWPACWFGWRTSSHRFDTFLERGGATEAEWRELLSDIAGYALCGLVWVAHGSDPSSEGRDDE